MAAKRPTTALTRPEAMIRTSGARVASVSCGRGTCQECGFAYDLTAATQACDDIRGDVAELARLITTTERRTLARPNAPEEVTAGGREHAARRAPPPAGHTANSPQLRNGQSLIPQSVGPEPVMGRVSRRVVLASPHGRVA
ncbi:hypothetical protein MPRM_29810 [Mycobacterium parmense]|uniref:Uncharacterized protein n=1 Tax=Mycobacterium parmense TaxID=185642 RepID=A0A7I7YV91_9MYCO|nr:hypothetical protein MPRM_29810 [Mycobacterium parmense]